MLIFKIVFLAAHSQLFIQIARCHNLARPAHVISHLETHPCSLFTILKTLHPRCKNRPSEGHGLCSWKRRFQLPGLAAVLRICGPPTLLSRCWNLNVNKIILDKQYKWRRSADMFWNLTEQTFFWAVWCTNDEDDKGGGKLAGCLSFDMCRLEALSNHWGKLYCNVARGFNYVTRKKKSHIILASQKKNRSVITGNSGPFI